MFLDANIFIHAYYDSKNKQSQLSKSLLSRVLSGESNACTSVLVLNEVHYFFLKEFGAEKANKIFSNILNYKNLEILPVNKDTLSFVEQYVNAGLETSDAFHVAVMKANNLSTMCSYDKAFDKIYGVKRQEPK